jgi:ribose 5-phosphate isomerase B
MAELPYFVKTRTKIIIGCDHGGIILKNFIKQNLDKSYILEDIGVFNASSCDYPDIAKTLCANVLSINKDCINIGILICGTGIGMSMTANRIKGIRCALCTNNYMAKMAIQHNNANVLALGERVMGQELALSIVKTFIEEFYEPEERHDRRINKIEIKDSDLKWLK